MNIKKVLTLSIAIIAVATAMMTMTATTNVNAKNDNDNGNDNDNNNNDNANDETHDNNSDGSMMQGDFKPGHEESGQNGAVAGTNITPGPNGNCEQHIVHTPSGQDNSRFGPC